MIAPSNQERSDSSEAALDAMIYIVSGNTDQERMNAAEAYDPGFNQWILVREMKFRRNGVSYIIYHVYVYAIGGFNAISSMCNGRKYDLTTNEWTQIPDICKHLSNFGIEMTDHMIFSTDGLAIVAIIHNVECYEGNLNL